MNLFWSLYSIVMFVRATIFCVECPRYRGAELFTTEEEAWICPVGGVFPSRASRGPFTWRLPSAFLRRRRWVSRRGSGSKGLARSGPPSSPRTESGLRLAFTLDVLAMASLVRRIFRGDLVCLIKQIDPGTFAVAAIRRALG